MSVHVTWLTNKQRHHQTQLEHHSYPMPGQRCLSRTISVKMCGLGLFGQQFRLFSSLGGKFALGYRDRDNSGGEGFFVFPCWANPAAAYLPHKLRLWNALRKMTSE